MPGRVGDIACMQVRRARRDPATQGLRTTADDLSQCQRHTHSKADGLWKVCTTCGVHPRSLACMKAASIDLNGAGRERERESERESERSRKKKAKVERRGQKIPCLQ